MNRTLLLGSAALFAALLVAPGARADGPENSGAEALAREGSALLEAGNVSAACAKYEKSLELDQAVSTLESLAQCREKEGRIASAWSHYTDLVGRAVKAGQADREKELREKAAQLELRIPQVTLKLAGHDEVTAIELDGQRLSRAAWATPLSLDPGSHVFVFSAPGRDRAERRVVLADSEKLTLEPPPLLEIAPPPSTTITIDPSLVVRDDGSKKRFAGGVSLAVGGLGVIVGTIFGVAALGAKSDADDLFARGDPGFKAKDEDASTNALVSTVAFGFGIAGVAVGTYLLVTARSDRPPRGQSGPRVFATGSGLGARF